MTWWKHFIAWLIAWKYRFAEKESARVQSRRIKRYNPYGMVGLVASGFTFFFPSYGLSFVTLLFCIVTFFTFEPDKEDNRWPFYLGVVLSILGIKMFVTGMTHAYIL